MGARHFRVLLRNELLNSLRSWISVFWAVIFPVFFLLIMLLAFGNDRLGTVNIEVADLDGSAASRQFVQEVGVVFERADTVDAKFVTLTAADTPVEKGAVRLTIPAGFGGALAAGNTVNVSAEYDRNGSIATQAAGRIVEAAAMSFNLSYRDIPPAVTVEYATSGRRSGLYYALFFVTGILITTIMSTGIMSTSIAIASMREQNMFKLYACMPVTAGTVIGSILLTRLLIMLGAGVIFLFIARYLFDVPINVTGPEMLASLPLLLLGGVMFLSMGMLIGARVTTVAGAEVIANFIYFPLMFLGDLTFPLSEFPTAAKQVLGVIPVNQLVAALRRVLFDNESLMANWGVMLAMCGWSALFLFLASRSFKWGRV